MIPSPAPAVAAAMIRARRRLKRAFAEATSEETAIAYEPKRRMEQRYFQSLIDYGAVVPTGRGTYWLDEARLRRHSARRRKRAAGIIGAAVAVGAAIVGLSNL
jgi:hypothetical protein